MDDPVEETPLWIARTQLILDSYRHWRGDDLIPRGPTPAADAIALYESGRVVVAHGTEADPLLNYANRAAQQLWEADLATLLGMPSRLTAEAPERDERRDLLERVSRDGLIDDYQGIRISVTGRRFRISRAIVWNLRDDDGNLCGQAATFQDWQDL